MTSPATPTATSTAAFQFHGAKKSLVAPLSQPRKIRPFSKMVLVDLFRGLSSMLRAQINTADALKYYSNGLPNKMLVESLLRIREDISNGLNVHEAFRRTGRFSDTVVGLIQAGSDAGQLHQAFGSLALRLKSELYFSKQLKRAVSAQARPRWMSFPAFRH